MPVFSSWDAVPNPDRGIGQSIFPSERRLRRRLYLGGAHTPVPPFTKTIVFAPQANKSFD